MPSRPSREERSFGDSSGPFFSIYSTTAEEEDNKMVDRWQKDADGILFFVSPCVGNRIVLYLNWNIIDRSILCRSCCTSRFNRPGPEAKQSGYLSILSWEYLRGSRRPKRNTCFHPLPRKATPVFSFEIYCLGELTLVLKPGYESQLCTVGDIFASMGASIYPSYTAYTVQSREASAYASILFQWGGQDACSVGS